MSSANIDQPVDAAPTKPITPVYSVAELAEMYCRTVMLGQAVQS